MKKRVLVIVTVLVLIFTMLPMQLFSVSAAPNVKPSTVDYTVFLNASQDVYFCNSKTVGAEIGTTYYMTYTVKKVTGVPKQQGVVGTADPTRHYPYENGGYMYYAMDGNNQLLAEGYTYFFAFTITENGYDYKVARAKGSESEYVLLAQEHGAKTDKMGYFGVWFSVGTASAELIKVRCYDKNGNDLGVQSPYSAVAITNNKPIANDTTIDHRYDITATNVSNFAISNELTTDCNKVYMEYTVESAEGNLYQNGLSLANSPKSSYPFTTGLLQQNSMTGEENPGPLLTPGASYVIEFIRAEGSFQGLVQKTLDGKTEWFVFPIKYGTHDSKAEYFSMWFGEGDTHKVSFVIRNFKCYDQNKKNLKVQTNKSASIRHIGALEDYSGCKAMYYCDAEDAYYILMDDQTLKYLKDGNTIDGTYAISSGVITITLSNGTVEKATYLYGSFTTENEKVFRRLYSYRLKFITGTDKSIDDQLLNSANGYVATEPDAPTKKGAKFKGWYTKNGKKFDFNKYVVKSETLYAMWEGEDGITYTAISASVEKKDFTPVIFIAISAVVLLASVAVAIILVLRGKKGAKNVN